MAPEPTLSVLFLWHQHQPYYKDPLSNRYELPWVRLHATKDYFDMVALLEDYPKIRANFNLVPSLLVQLEDYAQGKAHDRYLAVSRKEATQLSFEEKLFILQTFFMANWQHMVDPYPRYRELLDKRGRSGKSEDMARAQGYFKEQDWRDLQVWFNLTWFDPYWREKNVLVGNLHKKGKTFTEEEKNSLLDLQLSICGQIATKHREMMEKGQIEVTATPFYHPILPLLNDLESARMAMPQVTLPRTPFQYPSDAREQIQKALTFHEERFGRRPQGMWPSEGSVSEAVAEQFAEAKVRWVATDEAVLAHSLSPHAFHREDLFHAYRRDTAKGPLHFFFRDHGLSDAIGFTYSSWKAEDAAADFIKRLHEIRKSLTAQNPSGDDLPIVSVILDGENCWEYYPQDGVPFLRELYKRLSDDPLLETVRGSDYLDRAAAKVRTLPKVWSGSWINSNFAIWIGHSEDNKAWELLTRTRDFLEKWGREHSDRRNSEAFRLAWEEIYIAEGSDWCWWYGDDHSSANDETFDYLFRKHLMNVYTALGSKAPEDLHVAIKRKRTEIRAQPAIDFISPEIDGKITNYYEWQSAGQYYTEAGVTGTMHRAQNILRSFHFGFDHQNLYFRLDLSRPLPPDQLTNHTFRLTFIAPEGAQLELKPEADGTLSTIFKPSSAAPLSRLSSGKIGKILEFALPLSAFPPEYNRPFKLFFEAQKDQTDQERWPVESPLEIPFPSEEAFAENWLI